MWVDKDKGPPDVRQMVLLCWAKPRPTPDVEVGCFIHKGNWEFDFLWSSGRFGHPSVDLATHWMPFHLPVV